MFVKPCLSHKIITVIQHNSLDPLVRGKALVLNIEGNMTPISSVLVALETSAGLPFKSQYDSGFILSEEHYRDDIWPGIH